MQSRAPLILASSSPRRLALLRQVGVNPDRIAAPEVDETPSARELPRAHVLRLAEAKASDVARRPEAAGAFVLAADTVVACGRRILGKADDEAAAERCLRLISGRRHRVYTAVAVVAPDGRRALRVVLTVVRFKRLHGRDIAGYLASGEWRGKAGGYAIQGRAEAFILSINGSYSNVVGLPLATALDLLGGLGWRSEP
ncbi:MAG TPA: Maf family nucleotide pyrophosphatase [Geminicoccaceae bacterium]